MAERQDEARIGRKYDTERAVSEEQAEGLRAEILAFMADGDNVAKYLLTYRRDGRARMRPVGAYMDGWHIQNLTQDVHLKTGHVRRDPRVGYLFSGMSGRDRGNDPVSVFVEGVAELIEDQDVVMSFLRWRAGKQGLDPGYPHGDFVPLLIRTTPLYLRAEGFSGRRHPVVYTTFPGVEASP
ncbi:MAG: hypothetical protein O3C25_04335 [Chloroflexi bacterium]|nr:hypothetical protein [Chloroflexota bacterium]